MNQLRIALAQINPTVGDVAGNAALVLASARAAHEAGADLVAFPEMALTGYPIEDLAYRESLVQASRQTLTQLATQLDADGLGDLAVFVGYLDADGPLAPGAARPVDGGPRNAAAVLHRGSVATRYFKRYLPNYGVFDEARYFVPGDQLPIVRLRGVDIAVLICDDIWRDGAPISAVREANVGLVVAINGSPYEQHKDHLRFDLCRARAAEAGATLAYVNMVGGQDELVFDGDSQVVSPHGELLARAAQFVEQLLVLDVEAPAASSETTGKFGGMRVRRINLDEPGPAESAGPAPAPATPSSSTGHIAEKTPRISPVVQHRAPIAELLPDDAEMWQALVVGLRDYANKNGFPSVVMGVSGGIDSALCAALACDALGPDRVYGVAMPSAYSSQHSLDDAAQLAHRTGMHYQVTPIEPMYEAYQKALSLTGIAAENLQARVRGNILMGLSNQHGHLVLATGNKSEYAVGYSTLYGDMVGGFAPIKDVLKTSVWQLAEWRNADGARRGETPPIPETSISKPPSAELRPDQLDSDSLPNYEILDAVLLRYINHDEGRAELIAAGNDASLVDEVLHLVDAAEYKRRQSAPGTKITLKSFGRDRRLPMTNRWREHEIDH